MIKRGCGILAQAYIVDHLITQVHFSSKNTFFKKEVKQFKSPNFKGPKISFFQKFIDFELDC